MRTSQFNCKSDIVWRTDSVSQNLTYSGVVNPLQARSLNGFAEFQKFDFSLQRRASDQSFSILLREVGRLSIIRPIALAVTQIITKFTNIDTDQFSRF